MKPWYQEGKWHHRELDEDIFLAIHPPTGGYPEWFMVIVSRTGIRGPSTYSTNHKVFTESEAKTWAMKWATNHISRG